MSGEMLKEVGEISKELEPRKEYVEGVLKLDYSYRFPTGEVLEATESNGEAKIVIKRKGEIIVDFNKLMPLGGRLLTPSYWSSETRAADKEGNIGNWGGGGRSLPTILVGDMRDPRSIFALLHEMGHTWRSGVPRVPYTQTAIETESGEERKAWAKAISLARQIKKDSGLNLFNVFEDSVQFQKFVQLCLFNHRLKTREYLGLDWREWLSVPWLKKLFDKGKLGRIFRGLEERKNKSQQK